MDVASTSADTLTAWVGPEGEVMVPTEVANMLRPRKGDTLVASVEDGRLVVRTFETAVEELRALFSASGGGVADELIVERREEARKELLDYTG